MKKHTILFLAANPLGTDRLALDEEARAIQIEFERSAHRNQFELVSQWAVRPLDLLRSLRKLQPVVVHFSGHGCRGEPGELQSNQPSCRDITGEPIAVGVDHQRSLLFQGRDGRPQLISTAALEKTFGAAGSSVKLVVLNACYTEVQAEALLAHVDCVVGMGGSIRDDVAKTFAIGFYGGLGEQQSIAAAYRQGCAAITLSGLPINKMPQLKVRDGIDAERCILAESRPAREGAKTTVVAAPTMRYAAGVGQISALISFVIVWLTLRPRITIISGVVLMSLMTVLFVFSRLRACKSWFKRLVVVLTWCLSLFMFAGAVLLASCFFLDNPKSVQCLAMNACLSNGSAELSRQPVGQESKLNARYPTEARGNAIASPIIERAHDVNIQFGNITFTEKSIEGTAVPSRTDDTH